jgi:hypothetical protein
MGNGALKCPLTPWPETARVGDGAPPASVLSGLGFRQGSRFSVVSGLGFRV